MMKFADKAILAALLVLLAAAAGAALLTRGWADYRNRLRLLPRATSRPVDMRPLETAQQLAQLAVTHTEQDYAQQALRLADRSVDLAFAAAIDAASENPAPVTPQTRNLVERVKNAEAAIAADQNRITHFTAAMAHAQGSAKDGLEELIGIAQAQLALDQDELEDARQDLISVGGDKQAAIQQLLDQHKASDAHSAAMHVGAPAATMAIELTHETNVVAITRAWSSLNTKEDTLQKAEQEALERVATLSAQHEALEKQGVNAGLGSPNPTGPPETNAPLALLRQQTEVKKDLASLDTRIQNEQQLAAVYGNWHELVSARAKSFLHDLFLSALWIVLIVLIVFIASYGLQRFFGQVARERRQMRTIDTVVLVSVQAIGLILILLVIFGVPSNFATVLALAGAGLTVALKDFIVGFLGWFVLMGKDGIRVGDWVEINGVGGEVLKLGPLHTVVLETGNWTDAGHPTGRKVSFVNSFAIEGHYFNFSTSGQWLWDEIELQVPQSVDPYSMADAIQKIAADETAQNAQLAESEWNRVTASRTFHATPSLSVRPASSGISVQLRYITRANERFEVRARLYRAIVELLQKKKIPDAVVATATPAVAERD
jgi:small-conductance mechanosensitive channel